METKIGPDFRKPFRGLTTIQLFDKNTGELLEEYHDENTYNDRLQYINYLDTILKCKNSNIPSKVAPFTRMNNDTTYGNDKDFFFNILAHSDVGTTSNRNYVRQLFATLWLTDSTKAETAHGYPNGFPVGIADTAGVNPTYTSYACSGVLNVSESYVGNDRLHLVFDFATDKCNVQFDALWLFPSMSKCWVDTTKAYNHDVTTFYQVRTISSEALDTQLLYKYSCFTINCYINGTYTVLGYSDSSSVDYTSAVQILNNSTGEIVSTVEFSSSKNVYAPMYYDAGNNVLYTLHTDDGSAAYILGQSNTSRALYKLDMSSGTLTRVGNLYDMLGLRWSDFDASSNKESTYTFVNVFKKDGSVATIFRLKCTSATDSSIKSYFVLFNFDPVTGTFTKVKKLEVFSENAWDSARMFMIDGIVYVMYPLSSTQQADYMYSAFDINTGAIKSTSIISPNPNILSDTWMDYSYSTSSYGKVYSLHDQVSYRRAICHTTSSDVSKSKVLKSCYFTAPWSTHNKLTSPIKKTNMTTMKIQYDIVWDNITEKIIPQLI